MLRCTVPTARSLGVKVAVHKLDLLVDTDCGEHAAGQRVEELGISPSLQRVINDE